MKGARGRRCHASAALIGSNGFITAEGQKKKKTEKGKCVCCARVMTNRHRHILMHRSTKEDFWQLALREGAGLPAAVRWWSPGPRPSSPATAPTLSSSAGSETPPPGCVLGTCAASRQGPPTSFCAVAPLWSEGFVLGAQAKPAGTIAAM